VFLAVGRDGSAKHAEGGLDWIEEHDKQSVLMDLLDAGGW